MARLALLLSAGLLFLLCSASFGALGGERSGEAAQGRAIAFQSFANAPDATHDGIWLVNSDGSDVRRLPNQPQASSSPSWSPDGRRIALDSLTGNGLVLYAIGADGSGLTRLYSPPTPTGVTLAFPTWSPDGTHLLVEHGRHCSLSVDQFCSTDLYAFDLRSGRSQRLPGTGDVRWGGSWSPDGLTIVFSRWTGSGLALVLVDRRGRVRQLTAGIRVVDEFPRWQRNGESIIFTRFTAANRTGTMYTIAADGSHLRAVGLPGQNNGAADFSPDDRSIVYVHGGASNGDIYTANLLTLKTHRLTKTPFDDSLPVWQP